MTVIKIKKTKIRNLKNLKKRLMKPLFGRPLPKDIINLIFSFDGTYRDVFKKCMRQYRSVGQGSYGDVNYYIINNGLRPINDERKRRTWIDLMLRRGDAKMMIENNVSFESMTLKELKAQWWDRRYAIIKERCSVFGDKYFRKVSDFEKRLESCYVEQSIQNNILLKSKILDFDEKDRLSKLKKMRVVDLKEELRMRWMPTSGNKDILISRLDNKFKRFVKQFLSRVADPKRIMFRYRGNRWYNVIKEAYRIDV